MRRALILKGALGPLTPLYPVFTGAGFARPEETDRVDVLPELVERGDVDLLVVPLEGAAPATLDLIEDLLRQRDGLVAIGTAPEASSDVILAAFRRGFSEFIVSPATPSDLSGALARLEAKWARAPKGGHITAVYSPAGGAGVTTIAVNLAHALSVRKPPGRVAVADLVVGLGDVSTHLNLSPTYDLGELVRKLDRADSESLHSITVSVQEGFDALTGTDDIEIGEDVTADAVMRIMDLMRSTYSYTVLDVEHTVSPRTIAALDGADRILLVFQVTVAGLRKAKRALAMFEQLEFAKEKIVLVANRVGTSDVMAWPDVAKALGRAVDFRMPNSFQLVADAQTRGVPIALAGMNGGSAQALIEAYQLLAIRIMGQKGFTPSAGASIVTTNGTGSGFGRLLSKLRK